MTTAKNVKADLRMIAEDVYAAARSNAFDTVCENTTKSTLKELDALGGRDLHPQFDEWVVASARMILDDISGRAFASYGYRRPLTAKQSEKVRALLVRLGVRL